VATIDSPRSCLNGIDCRKEDPFRTPSFFPHSWQEVAIVIPPLSARCRIGIGPFSFLRMHGERGSLAWTGVDLRSTFFAAFFSGLNM